MAGYFKCKCSNPSPSISFCPGHGGDRYCIPSIEPNAVYLSLSVCHSGRPFSEGHNPELAFSNWEIKTYGEIAGDGRGGNCSEMWFR